MTWKITGINKIIAKGKMRWSSNKFSQPIFQDIYEKETILENFGAHRVKWTFVLRWGRLYPSNTQHGHRLRDLQRKPALLGIGQGRLLVFLQVNMGVWKRDPSKQYH